MRAGLIIALATVASLCGGCADTVVRFGREIPPQHVCDPQYARLLKLYESGQINAEQLTDRQHELATLESDYARRRECERTHPTPDPFQ